MATNLPIGFNFNGRGRTAPPRIGYRADKGRTQAQFVPKLQRPLSNGGVDANSGLNPNWFPSTNALGDSAHETESYSYDWGNPYQILPTPGGSGPFWYPSARPLKQWRLSGTTNAIPTSSTTSSSDVLERRCAGCRRSGVIIGQPYKMLGRNEDGSSKDVTIGDNGCYLCDPTSGAVVNQTGIRPKRQRGTIMSFSGAAKLNSAVTTVNKNYYQSYSSYLRQRGKNYDSNSIVHQVPGIQYNKPVYDVYSDAPIGSEIVWPEKPQTITEPENSPFKGQTLDSSYYRGNACMEQCEETTGISGACDECMTTVGFHRHPGSGTLYPNDANGGVMCPVCVKNQGALHYHPCTEKVTNGANCSLSIYKPSNSQFSVQGAVDSSTRLTRLKLNTITRNNASFYNNGAPTQWGGPSPAPRSTIVQNLMYQANPVFFIKNKASVGAAFHRNGNKTVCGGYDQPCRGPSKMAFTLPLAIGGR